MSMARVCPAIRVVIAAATALAALGASSAAGQDATNLYAGAGLGVTDFKGRHSSIGYGDTPFGWQLYGGLQASDRMAVEVAAEHFSGIESGDLLGSGIERLRISADYSSVIVRGVFSLDLEELLRRRQRITVFGTVGVARLLEERNVTELTMSRITAASERQSALVLGAGVSFGLAGIRLRTYVQTTRRSEGLNNLGVAAEFRF